MKQEIISENKEMAEWEVRAVSYDEKAETNSDWEFAQRVWRRMADYAHASAESCERRIEHLRDRITELGEKLYG